MSMARSGTKQRTQKIIEHVEQGRTLEAKREIVELFFIIRNAHYGDAVNSLGAFLETWVDWSMVDIRDPIQCQVCGQIIQGNEVRHQLHLLGFECNSCHSGTMES